MSHRCLSVEDIVLCLCETIYTPRSAQNLPYNWSFDRRREYNSQTRASLQNLSAFSKTCRSIRGPALDVLWRTQWGLAPLLQCVPTAATIQIPSKWGVRPIISFRHPPCSSDWRIVEPFARRIRYMVADSPLKSTAQVSAATLAALLAICPNRSLLPNLQSLYPPTDSITCALTGEHNPTIDQLPSLVNDNLVSLSLYLRCTELEYFGSLLVGRCQVLEALRIDLSSVDDSRGDSDAVSNMLRLLTYLRCLRSLTLSIGSDMSGRPSPIRPRLHFSQLRSLAIYVHSVRLVIGLSTLLAVLEAVDADNLEDLSIASLEEPNLQLTQHPILTIINSKISWRQSLRSLELSLGDNTEAPGTAVSWNGVPPELATISQLRSVWLHVQGLVITDSVVLDIARTWPLLESLEIGHPGGKIGLEFSWSSVTLGCLKAVMGYCPGLRVLRIYVPMDASSVPRPPLLGTTHGSTQAQAAFSSHREPEVVEILIDDKSPIADPGAVGEYLRALVPGKFVKLVLWKWLYDSDMWVSVRDYLDSLVPSTL